VASLAVPGTRWWARVDAHPVVRLADVTADDLAAALDPLPPDAPAVVFGPPIAATTVAAGVAEILDALERAAIDLFPAWLPGATGIAGPQGAAEAAVRTAARSLAAGSEDSGPFLAELAVHALRGRPAPASTIPAQRRAIGLVRVIARSLSRDRAALVLEVPPDLTAHGEQVLAGAARWLAEHATLAVWLVGEPLRAVDWINSWPVRTEAPAVVAPPATEPAAPIQLAVRGRPRRGAETRLAEALAATDWAGTHLWNGDLALGALTPIVRPDVRWPDERVIVEIDGPEHCGAAKYAADRRRDALLLLHDHAVLRFTNDQVNTDLGYVVHTIRAVLLKRRTP